jgi:hypothetical protein
VVALLPILLWGETDRHVANPFGILAGLDQSPTETKWAFGFDPATSTTARRPVKRADRRHKSKHTRKGQNKGRQSESVEEICKRLFTVQPKGDPLAQLSRQDLQGHGVDLSKPSATFSTEGARRHWAPQLCSDSLPITSTFSGQTTKAAVQTESLNLPEAVRFNLSSQVDQTNCLFRHNEQSYLPLPNFPLLPDLAFDDEPLTKVLRTFDSESAESSTQTRLTPPPSTNVKIEATPRACIVLVSERDKSPIVSGCTSSASCIQASDLAFPVNASKASAVMAPSLSAVHDADVCQFYASLRRWKGLSLTSPRSHPPLLSNAKISADGPLPGLGSLQLPFPEARHVQRAPIPTWTEHSGGITIFRPYPLITAPVGSPYPFVDGRLHSSSLAVPQGLDNSQLSASIMERRKAALIPIGLEEQKNREDFLAMGHPAPCWCSQHVQSTNPLNSLAVGSLQDSPLPRVKPALELPLHDLEAIPHPHDSLEISPISLSDNPMEPEHLAHPMDDALLSPTIERASDSRFNPPRSSLELCSDDWTVVTPIRPRRLYRSQSLPNSHTQPSPLSDSSSSSNSSSPSTPNQEYELLIVSSSPSASWETSPLLSPTAGKSRFS